MQSEPLAQLRLIQAFSRANNTRFFCAKNAVVETRMRQLALQSSHILKRALGAMPPHVAKSHDVDSDDEDVSLDPARLNRCRLLLVWTARDAIFELQSVKNPTATEKLALTGPRLEERHMQRLLPANAGASSI